MGPYVDMGAEEDADGYSDDDAADGEDSDLDDQWFFLDAMSSDAEQDSPQAFDNSYVVAGVLPRLARSMGLGVGQAFARRRWFRPVARWGGLAGELEA